MAGRSFCFQRHLKSVTLPYDQRVGVGHPVNLCRCGHLFFNAFIPADFFFSQHFHQLGTLKVFYTHIFIILVDLVIQFFGMIEYVLRIFVRKTKNSQILFLHSLVTACAGKTVHPKGIRCDI